MRWEVRAQANRAGVDGDGPATAAPLLALRRLRRRALVAGFPLAVAALNRAGLGPLRAEISSGELRRAGLRAMDEVAARLGLGDAYVVFGHTHRAGPLPGDREQEWRGGHAPHGRVRRAPRERGLLDLRADLPDLDPR